MIAGGGEKNREPRIEERRVVIPADIALDLRNIWEYIKRYIRWDYLFILDWL